MLLLTLGISASFGQFQDKASKLLVYILDILSKVTIWNKDC